MQTKLSLPSLVDPNRTLARRLIMSVSESSPWEAIPRIGDALREIMSELDSDGYYSPTDGVFIAKTASVAHGALILPPAVICEGAEIRHGAFIRGSALVGRGAVVGNSTELKNVILFDEAKLPHYNYAGDSIIGFGAHFGAGALTSNVKMDHGEVTVCCGDERCPTSLRKFGAIVGDGTEVGCGAVLCPGSIIGRGSRVYPLTMFRGTLGDGMIYKQNGETTAIISEEE